MEEELVQDNEREEEGFGRSEDGNRTELSSNQKVADIVKRLKNRKVPQKINKIKNN